MDTLHAQKENVDANVRGGVAGKVNFAGPDKFTTPKRGFVIHEDSKSGSNKKGLKDSNSTKKRRVLGDISNKQENRQHGTNSGGVASGKKPGLGKGLGHSKKVSAKKKTKTPLKNKVRASLTPKTTVKPLHVEEVPDIECAYGGLPSPTAHSAYVKGLRDEIVRDILNDTTPTLFDDFDSAFVVDDWDDTHEKAMLESGEPPSPWWAPEPHTLKEKEDTSTQGETGVDQVHDNLEDLPPPDNLPDDAVPGFDDDGLLDDILSVDVEAACNE